MLVRVAILRTLTSHHVRCLFADNASTTVTGRPEGRKSPLSILLASTAELAESGFVKSIERVSGVFTGDFILDYSATLHFAVLHHLLLELLPRRLERKVLRTKTHAFSCTSFDSASTPLRPCRGFTSGITLRFRVLVRLLRVNGFTIRLRRRLSAWPSPCRACDIGLFSRASSSSLSSFSSSLDEDPDSSSSSSSLPSFPSLPSSSSLVTGFVLARRVCSS